MNARNIGLTHLTTGQLERLLKAVHRGIVSCPLTPEAMMVAGLSDVHDRVEHLRGVDEAGVRATLVAVLAERQKAAQRRPSA